MALRRSPPRPRTPPTRAASPQPDRERARWARARSSQPRATPPPWIKPGNGIWSMRQVGESRGWREHADDDAVVGVADGVVRPDAVVVARVGAAAGVAV